MAEAKRVLDRFYNTLHLAKTISVNARIQGPGGNWFSSSHRASKEGGAKVIGPQGDIRASDGQTVFGYDPRSKLGVVGPGRLEVPFLYGFEPFWSSFRPAYTLNSAVTQDIFQGKPAYRIEGPTSRGALHQWIFLDKSRCLPIGYVRQNGIGRKLVSIYSDLRLNAPMSANDFLVAFPEGTSVRHLRSMPAQVYLSPSQ